MKTSMTHTIEVVSPTGETTTTRHDFSIYKTRSPHWDKYARAVLQPIIASLELNGFKARIATVKTNQGV
jgi:hypothetical protein